MHGKGEATMSMNDVYEQERLLLREIENFNAELARHFKMVQEAHASVAPLWDDDMQREYNPKWAEVGDALENYIRRTGPEYAEFLKQSIVQLEIYLGVRGR